MRLEKAPKMSQDLCAGEDVSVEKNMSRPNSKSMGEAELTS